jgi:hypothetical protein
VFGIQDYRAPGIHALGEQSKILHYMASHTGGQYFSSSPSGYAAALEAVLTHYTFATSLGLSRPRSTANVTSLKSSWRKEPRRNTEGFVCGSARSTFPFAKGRSGRTDRPLRRES